MNAQDAGMGSPDRGDDDGRAHVDEITGLGGPDALLSALDLAIEVGRPEQRTVTLLMLDVELGGPPGDQQADENAYRGVAGAIATACRREGDSLFRVGPQRFAAVLPAASAEAARAVGRRAVASIDAAGIAVRVWTGVAEWPFDGATSEELFESAHPIFEVVREVHDEAASDDGRLRRAEELSARTVASTLVLRARWLDGHADRVARLAREVAQMLCLDAEVTEAADLAAQLHDIGMISLPDSVLLRESPLDPTGWAGVKATPDAGAKIVSGFRSLAHLAPVIRAHREHWDGTGYPQGLAGDAIPLASRIVGACEAYDAMISQRPDRAPLTAKAARDELGNEAGRHYDPAVVAALDRVLDRHRTGTPIATNGMHRTTV